MKLQSAFGPSASAYPQHDFPHAWTALDLADAFPLRLSERLDLGLVDVAPAPVAANSPFLANARPWRHRAYARSAELPVFVRVR